MQNSTQWCSLYSIESKCNINVAYSKAKHKIIRSCLALYVFLACYSFYQLYFNDPHTQIFNYIAVIIVLVAGFILSTYLLKSSNDNHVKQLVLHRDGLIDYGEYKGLTLGINSRIGWLGCWLILIQPSINEELSSKQKFLLFDSKRIKPMKVFIFKDSLSVRDYARLSQQVLANHRPKFGD